MNLMDYAVILFFMMPFYVTAARYYGKYFKRGFSVDAEPLMAAYTYKRYRL